MTGHLERPSQGTQENRKANQDRGYRQHRRLSAGASMRGLHRAEMDLLIAAQRAARHAALQTIDAALNARHASATAAVVARFAGQRAALTDLDAGARAAALHRLSAEEAQELAQLALAHAAERRALKRAAVQAMVPTQKAARQGLRRASRRQRAVLAIALRPRIHKRAEISRARARPPFKITTRR